MPQNLAEQDEEEVTDKSMSLCFFALRNQVQTLERDTPRGVALRGAFSLVTPVLTQHSLTFFLTSRRRRWGQEIPQV